MANKSKGGATVKGNKGKASKRKPAPVEAPEAPAPVKGKGKGKPAVPVKGKGKRKALPVETTEGAGGTFRYTLYGLPITAILRWYGSKGAAPRTVYAALVAAAPNLSNTTVGIQVAAGRHGGNCGGRGELPELTKEQERELLAALES